MKKRSDTTLEYAQRLKKKGKTPEDAAKHYLRHLERKRSTGRKPGGTLSGIKPDRETWDDICNRIICGTAEWRILRLRELLASHERFAVAWSDAGKRQCQLFESQKQAHDFTEQLKHDKPKAKVEASRRISLAPDNYLSARAAEIWAKAASAPSVTQKDLRALRNELRSRQNGKPPTREEWVAERDKLYIAKTGKPYQAPGEPHEIAWLWNEFNAEFERAVLDGDAEWFKRQAKAIAKGGMPQRVQFNTNVVRVLEQAMSVTWAKQRAKQEKNEKQWKEARKKQQIEWEQYLDSPEGGAAGPTERQARFAALTRSQKARPHVESATLTPAGKVTDAMASDIYNALEKRELPDGGLMVEGYQFENKARVMETIHDLAKRLQFALRKQH